MNFIVTEATPLILIMILCVKIYQTTSNDANADTDDDAANANDVREATFLETGFDRVATLEKSSTKIFLSFSIIFLVSNFLSVGIDILELIEADFQVKPKLSLYLFLSLKYLPKGHGVIG